jgi:micrococcal nuclease
MELLKLNPKKHMENQTMETDKKNSIDWVAIVKAFLILAFLPFVAIWFVWKKSTLSKKGKWIVTAIIVFVLLVFLAAGSDDDRKKERENEMLKAKVSALEEKLEQEKEKQVAEEDKSFAPLLLDDDNKVVEIEFFDVISVTDGDTIKINFNGKIETLRLIGMDTPETVDPRKPVQCFGKESSEKAKEILSGKKVRLEADPTQGDRDQYGRLLRFVFLEDGTFFNKKMIEDGFAHEYTFQSKPYKYQAEFQDAENSARENNRGLWAPDTCNGDTEKSATVQKTEAAPVAEVATAPVVVESQVATQAPQSVSSTGGVVKKSSTGICHAPGTTYYEKTKNFIAFDSISACLASGGRLPRR